VLNKIKNGIPERKNKTHAVLLKSKCRIAEFELFNVHNMPFGTKRQIVVEFELLLSIISD
jgi:hypothetical protein